MKKINGLATVGLFLSAWLSGCVSERYKEEDKFAGIEKKLTASVNELTRVPPKVELASEPYIKGKIAVFQALEKKYGNTKDKSYFMPIYYFRGLEEIYAAEPEEVGTVALLDCQTLKKGVYKTEDGSEHPAEVEDCELTMIDRTKPAVVLKRKFEKTPSDERRVYGNSVIRQSAMDDILQFLKGLPKR